MPQLNNGAYMTTKPTNTVNKRKTRGLTDIEALTKVVTGLQKTVGRLVKQMDAQRIQADQNKSAIEACGVANECVNRRVDDIRAGLHKVATRGEY